MKIQIRALNSDDIIKSRKEVDKVYEIYKAGKFSIIDVSIDEELQKSRQIKKPVAPSKIQG